MKQKDMFKRNQKRRTTTLRTLKSSSIQPLSNCHTNSITTSITIKSQVFDVVLDTTSPNLWIPSTRCDNDVYCGYFNKFDVSSSKVIDQDFKVTAPTEDLSILTLEGLNVQEDVALGEYTIQNQHFGVISSFPPRFYPMCGNVDGVLGLGKGSDSFIQSLVTGLNVPVVSLFLNSGLDDYVVHNNRKRVRRGLEGGSSDDLVEDDDEEYDDAQYDDAEDEDDNEDYNDDAEDEEYDEYDDEDDYDDKYEEEYDDFNDEPDNRKLVSKQDEAMDDYELGEELEEEYEEALEEEYEEEQFEAEEYGEEYDEPKEYEGGGGDVYDDEEYGEEYDEPKEYEGGGGVYDDEEHDEGYEEDYEAFEEGGANEQYDDEELEELIEEAENEEPGALEYGEDDEYKAETIDALEYGDDTEQERTYGEYDDDTYGEEEQGDEYTPRPIYARSEMIIGGVNPKRYTGCLFWHPTTQDDAWTIHLDSKVHAQIASATELIHGPVKDVGQFLTANKALCYALDENDELGTKLAHCEDGFDVAFFDCNNEKFVKNFTPLTFMASGQMYTLGFDQLVQAYINEQGHQMCEFRIASDDIHDNHWVFGTPFFSKYYIALDVAKGYVGIAEQGVSRSGEFCKEDEGFFIGSDVAVSKAVVQSAATAAMIAGKESTSVETNGGTSSSAILAPIVIIALLVVGLVFYKKKKSGGASRGREQYSSVDNARKPITSADDGYDSDNWDDYEEDLEFS